MIGYMGAQQKKQLEGLEEVALFTAREMGTFKSNIYPILLEEVHQTLAKASLACSWLNDDLANLDGLPNQSQLTPIVATLQQNISQVCGILLSSNCPVMLLFYICSCSNTNRNWLILILIVPSPSLPLAKMK